MAKKERHRRGSNTDRPQQLHKQSQDCPWRAKNSAQRGCYKAVSDCLIARHIITMIVVALALLTAKATRLYMFDLAVVTAMLCASRACAATQSWRWLPPCSYRLIALHRPRHFSQRLSLHESAHQDHAQWMRDCYIISLRSLLLPIRHYLQASNKKVPPAMCVTCMRQVRAHVESSGGGYRCWTRISSGPDYQSILQS